VTDEAQGGDSERPSWRRDDWLGVAVFGAASLSAALWLLDLGRNLTFFYDEWNFVEESATTGYWHNVLQPHNGHPSMIPFSMYEVLLHTVGLRHYWPYQVILVLLDIGCGWLLFLLLRRKVHPLVAGASSAVLMLLGPAWQDLLWPFQFGFLGSVAGGLGALVLLDRDSQRADIGASACLVASVACSGVGLPFLAGVIVELAWRRRSWRRLWIPAIPFGLFVIWYGAIGKSASSSTSPTSIVQSVGSDTATTLGALVGRGSTVGYVLTAVLGAAIIVAVVRSPGRAARLAMATSGLLAFWMLTLLARGVSQNSASRYLYPAAALALIAVGELPALIARSHRGHHASRTSSSVMVMGTVAACGVVAYAALAIWWNAGGLTGASGGLGAISAQVKAELGVVTLARGALPAAFQPDGARMPQVTVGPYLKAVAQFGSPTPTPTNVGHRYGTVLDAMLLRGRPMEVSPIPFPDKTLTAGKGCQRSVLGPSSPTVVFTLPQRGSVITAPRGTRIALRVKAFAPAFPAAPLTTIARGRTAAVTWSPVPTRVHWTVEVTPVPAPAPVGSFVTVCPDDAGAGASTGT
jgi:hypothetical protein